VNGINNANGHVNGNGSDPVAPLAPAALPLPSPEQIRELNVHQRIRWITAEARSLPKSQWNPDGQFQYAGHDQIVDMLRALLGKYGVNIYQEPLKFEREVSYSGVEHLTRVWYSYEVVNADHPDDKLVRHNWGEALDNGDKGLNKCSTIAEKVFMLRLFKISTFDDPDGHSAEKNQNRAALQTNGDKGRRAAGPAHNECQDCHELITTAMRDHKTWQSSEVIAAARRTFGKRLCVDCYLKALAKEAQHSPQAGGTTPQPQNPGENTAAGNLPDRAPKSTHEREQRNAQA